MEFHHAHNRQTATFVKRLKFQDFIKDTTVIITGDHPSMGCKISGDRLGLVTNLFSGKKTLAETCGYDKIEGELAKRSPFYEQQILEEFPKH